MRGVYTALITPFNKSNEVDLGAFKRVLCDQVEAGVAGVIPCGTTGESPTLTQQEKKLLITTCVETLKGTNVKVLAGTGSNSTPDTIEFSKWASDQGVNGLLLVTPYYNKPSQTGLQVHFRQVADAVSCEVMLYNVPGRTGVSLTAESISELSTHPRITSLKEATGNVAFTSEIIDVLNAKGRKIDILGGDDATFLPLLSVGAVGVVSVASNLFPRAMVAIQKAMEAGRLEEARSIHQKFYPLFRDLFVESNPVPVKVALSITHGYESYVRAPLSPLSVSSAEILKASLSRCGVMTGSRL